MEVIPVQRPHAIFLPMAAQGHINPMMKLAILFHSNGFFITFVYTDFDRDRLLKSVGPDAIISGSEDFRFATISDGLPPSDHGGNRHIPSLVFSLRSTGLAAFSELLAEINKESPPVTLVVWDGLLGFGRQAAAEIGAADTMFWTASACGLMGYINLQQLVERGIAPLKDESLLSNGFLDTPVDWIPSMPDIRLSDLPATFRTTDPNDPVFNITKDTAQSSPQASSIIMNTFEELESEVLAALAAILPPIYTIGPLNMLSKQVADHSKISSLPSNLWKEDTSCIEWLDQRDPRTVVYVNFGSIISLSMDKLAELAWGLANSKQFFLWVVRSDIVAGEAAVLPEDFVGESEGRCLIVNWCSQEQVLMHPSVGAFLTHCGWNSMLEGICSGVPLICWPCFAEQTTNCHYACKRWGIGLAIGDGMKRGEIEGIVREVMEGEKGREMRNKAKEWKDKAEKAAKKGGSSYKNVDKLFDRLLSGNGV